MLPIRNSVSPTKCYFIFLPLICILFLVLILPSSASSQQAGGIAPSGPQVRTVCSVAEAKSEQRNGSFVMTEARSTFYVPDDHEVIDYFEW